MAALLSALGLAACDDAEPPTAPEPVRAIKHQTLARGVAAQRRRIAGVVAAATTANVAFQASGQVIELAKKVGDEVAAGDLLARLDPEPLRLRLASAESESQKAAAAVADAESKYRQQKQLFDKGFATRTNFESALATLRTARGALGVARSQADIARRDLEKATLTAPFAGVVAKRNTEPFEEVASGQAVYTLQTEGENEVRVSLPETLIGEVEIGAPVDVVASLASDAPIPGRVTEIAPLAEGVNAYPVTIHLDAQPPGLRPGMSAEAIFEFQAADTADAFTIPISAFKPKVDEEGGQVFIFEEGALRARDVRVVNVRDNALQIVGDVKPGEIIATAGVSLLHDGMAARLLDPEILK